MLSMVPLHLPRPAPISTPCHAFLSPLPFCSLDLLLFSGLWRQDLALGPLQTQWLSTCIALSPESTSPHASFSLLQVLTQMSLPKILHTLLVSNRAIILALYFPPFLFYFAFLNIPYHLLTFCIVLIFLSHYSPT